MGIKMKKILRGSLYWKMTAMTILPLTVFGILISLYCSSQFALTIQSEVAEGLENMTNMMLYHYDTLYPGDYELYIAEGEATLYKGGTDISDTNRILDQVKDKTGIDFTIFFYDTRMITTIRSNDGRRITGTGSSIIVFRDVFEGQQAHFYKSAMVNAEEYFAYYMPLVNADGTCVGMIFAGKPARNVQKMIQRAVMPIVMIVLAVVLLTGWMTVRYTSKMVEAIKRMERFLSRMADSNLTDALDTTILNREDELGKMGRSAVKMQQSLRELIEQDSMTGLYNRRYGSRRMAKMREQAQQIGIPYCVAIGDIDFFKKVNDTYGHECGDLVLKNISLVLRKSMLGRGTAVRWGGEEFLLIFERDNLEEAEKEVWAILEKVRKIDTVYEDEHIQVSMTFGIAEGVEGEGTDEILRRADDKLYFGKMNGRNRVVV